MTPFIHPVGQPPADMQSHMKKTWYASAHMERDGTIVILWRWTYEDPSVEGVMRIKPGDSNYADMLKHLGGLKPGEYKQAPPPWDDKRRE